MLEVGKKVKFQSEIKKPFHEWTESEREKTDPRYNHTAIITSLDRLWTKDRIFHIIAECVDECGAEHGDDGIREYILGMIVPLKNDWFSFRDITDIANMQLKEV